MTYDLGVANLDKWLRRGIGELRPYVPGKSEEEVKEISRVSDIVKLASNENPFTPPAAVLEAINREAVRINRYPDGKCRSLAQELASSLGCSTDALIFGNGAEELILMVCQTFVNEKDPCVLVAQTFDAYETGIRMAGGTPVFSPLNPHYQVDLEEMAARVTSKTKLVFLPNPNNPTGTIFTRKEFESFLASLPRDTLIILDEAYAEYVEHPAAVRGIDYIWDVPLIVLRTFSKAYGLAGLRIGYAVAQPRIIKRLHHVRLPFNVNRLAQAAALAALRQGSWLRKHLRAIRREKTFLYQALKALDLSFVPSHTNFIFIDTKMDSDRIFQRLLREGVIVRPGSTWGFNTFIRLTVGTHRENVRFLNALKTIIS